MRTIVRSHEVPHLWAHKAQPSAYNSTRNFYFEGDTIYSYGRHFPIARHVTNKRKQAGILFTTDHYGITTSGHVGSVRHAIPPGVPLIYMPKVPYSGPKQYIAAMGLRDFAARIAKQQLECFGPTGRFRPREHAALDTLIGRANRFAEFFLSRKRWAMPENTDAIRDTIVRHAAAEARSRKRAIAAAAKRQAERNAALAGNLEAWRKGENVGYWDLPLPRDPVALRVRNDVVETSLGANVPIDHARLGLRFVRKCRDTHTPYQRNGHTLHLGHYAIDAIDELGNLTAGCHSIAIEEIERIAPLLEA